MEEIERVIEWQMINEALEEVILSQSLEAPIILCN
ncbi:uncharacterized protein G2W53_011698 [Senna tora]|uniref:Uncharacterized protein n=1 Tax=Senna tora TaxID=362788 RepID=A0A834X2N9_9FABA|nr:uncharacterized protein G2W53_011698 [Senna tora]